MPGARQYKCEWPDGCPWDASHKVYRGHTGKRIKVCRKHRKVFHELSDFDATAIAAARMPERYTELQSDSRHVPYTDYSRQADLEIIQSSKKGKRVA